MGILGKLFADSSQEPEDLQPPQQHVVEQNQPPESQAPVFYPDSAPRKGILGPLVQSMFGESETMPAPEPQQPPSSSQQAPAAAREIGYDQGVEDAPRRKGILGPLVSVIQAGVSRQRL